MGIAKAPEGRVPLLMQATEALLLAARDEHSVLHVATGLLAEHFGYGMRYILMWDPAKEELYVEHAAGPSADSPAVRGYRGKMGVGLTGIAAQTRSVVSSPDVESDPRYISVVPDCRSEICVPLVAGDELLGVLVIESTEKDAFSDDDEAVLLAFSRILALALLHARTMRQAIEAREAARQLAITDPLTGLYNTRYLHQRLAEEIARAERYGHELSLLFVDSDSLKKVNDTQGHLAGNDLIVHLAQTIKGQVRSTDLTARFGGDEFVVLMPESGTEAARATGERIRTAARSGPDIAGIERTVSVGIATYPQHAQAAEELIRRADDAQYEAKKGGKDRVAVAA